MGVCLETFSAEIGGGTSAPLASGRLNSPNGTTRAKELGEKEKGLCAARRDFPPAKRVKDGEGIDHILGHSSRCRKQIGRTSSRKTRSAAAWMVREEVSSQQKVSAPSFNQGLNTHLPRLGGKPKEP